MNVEAFFDAPVLVQFHALSAIAALVLGAVQILAPKGTLPHRTLGYVWVGLMTAVVSSAFFIRSHPNGSMSWIHIFIPITVMGVFGIIREARRHAVGEHRRTALFIFLGALVIPGAFTFMPGRTMYNVVFG